MANREQRIKGLIEKNVSEIIRFEMKDPGLGFITVTDAEVSNDFSYAKIFVSFMGSDNKEEQLARLNKAKGFIRTGLAKRLDIRKTPELTFVYDDTLDKAMHLEELLKKVEKK